MIWAIELGNTRTKVTCLDASGASIVDTRYFAPEDFSWAQDLTPSFPLRIANTAQRSVPQHLQICQVELSAPWPFQLDCSPSIGVDRCLAVLGARQLHPSGPLAVISCGTCLTGTLLDDQNRLSGGPISPGWTMRLRAMAHFAPALPVLSPEASPLTPRGTRSTESSMQQGAFAGMATEMEYWIQAWQREFPGIAIFITGGDGPAFAKPSESGIFAASNLEALGLLAQYLYEKHR